jgi:glycosyltransferase involved in cell wall biosynthesis
MRASGGLTPPISVLLCTRNRPDQLAAAVASILRQSFRNFELIVVDQSADGASKARLDALSDPRMRYIRTETIGLARARNVAIRASRAEILVFTDDDCVCDENWLAAIFEEYRRDRSLMGVYGRVLPLGPPREGMTCVCLNESRERRVYDRPVPHMRLGGGCNCSFRKDLFRRIGLYIESLGAGTWMRSGEDAELLQRALRRRARILYTPEPLVYHGKWLDRAAFSRLMLDSMLAYGALLVKFALELDALACAGLLRMPYYLARDRLGIGSRWRGLAVFSLGMLMGAKYRFVPPPRLPASPSASPPAAAPLASPDSASHRLAT